MWRAESAQADAGTVRVWPPLSHTPSVRHAAAAAAAVTTAAAAVGHLRSGVTTCASDGRIGATLGA